MLTRRHIRAKVMQSVYAMQQSQSQDLDKEVKYLQNSANEMYDLYLLHLSLLTELHAYAIKQSEVAQKKYLATPADTKQHQLIANNKFLTLISQNESLQKAIETAQMNLFDLHYEYVNNFYKAILESDYYKEYAGKESSFATDRDFVVTIFEEIIAPDDDFYEFIEDHNLTWVDDYPIVNTFIVKLFKNLRPNPPEKYFTPTLYNTDDEKLFLSDLFKKTVLNDNKLKGFIDDKLTNWDKERVAVLDNILLKMAVCELLYFPSIPIKVTINEYLELSKEYSTPKSSLFINGILNVIHKELEEKELIKKIGRGLL